MIYSSYFAKVNKIPYDWYGICRRPPKFVVDRNVYELAPSGDLLNRYKSGKISLPAYFNYFYDELTAKKDIITDKIDSLLVKSADIVLCCYERDYLSCHRKVVLEFLENNGYMVGGELHIL